jgi:hypothetical protein
MSIWKFVGGIIISLGVNSCGVQLVRCVHEKANSTGVYGDVGGGGKGYGLTIIKSSSGNLSIMTNKS